MLRNSMFIGVILLSTQVAFAQKTPEFSFGSHYLFFPETNVTIRYHCSGKTQVPWSIESADRKLVSGIARVTTDNVALVEFKTPSLKEGVTLELKLVIDDKFQPLVLVSHDVFADQRDWLDDLNIILLEDEDEIASDILDDAEIPFTRLVDENTTGALVLVAQKEFSRDKYVSIMRKNFVVVIAPEELEMIVPQMTVFDTGHTFLLTNDEKMIFGSVRKEDMPFRLWDGTSHLIRMFYVLGGKEEDVTLQTIGMNSSGTGWSYADFHFTRNRGRLLFINVPIFGSWDTVPDSRMFLKMLFEEAKNRQKSQENNFHPKNQGADPCVTL